MQRVNINGATYTVTDAQKRTLDAATSLRNRGGLGQDDYAVLVQNILNNTITRGEVALAGRIANDFGRVTGSVRAAARNLLNAEVDQMAQARGADAVYETREPIYEPPSVVVERPVYVDPRRRWHNPEWNNPGVWAEVPHRRWRDPGVVIVERPVYIDPRAADAIRILDGVDAAARVWRDVRR